MKTSRRRLLQIAAVAPAALVTHRPLQLFGGDAAAMAAEGLPVSASGLKIDGHDLIGHSLSWTSSEAAAADVRVRTGIGWTSWAEVHPDRGHGLDDPEREHSPPILVPGAIEYEISPRPGTVDLRAHLLAVGRREGV